MFSDMADKRMVDISTLLFSTAVQTILPCTFQLFRAEKSSWKLTVEKFMVENFMAEKFMAEKLMAVKFMVE